MRSDGYRMSRAHRELLHAIQVGRAALEHLAHGTEIKRREGVEIRAEIRAVMHAHQGLAKLTAKRVQPLLSRELSIRRIQEHMQIINAEAPLRAHG